VLCPAAFRAVIHLLTSGAESLHSRVTVALPAPDIKHLFDVAQNVVPPR